MFGQLIGGIAGFALGGGPGGAMVGAQVGGMGQGLLFGSPQPQARQEPPPTTPQPVTVAQNNDTGQSESSSANGYDPTKDVNGDGKVTQEDYALLQQNQLSMVA